MEEAHGFEVFIRSFEGRLREAQTLKTSCEQAFNVPVSILNTKEANCKFSEKFIYLLYSTLLNTKSSHVLILEDDMIFSTKAYSHLKVCCESNRSHMWYSVPSRRVLTACIQVSKFELMLCDFNNLHYSGAILIRTKLLRAFVEFYLLNILDFEFRNFDVNLSLFLKKEIGAIHISPYFFATNPLIQSSLETAKFLIKGRASVSNDCDPLYNLQDTHRSFHRQIT